MLPVEGALRTVCGVDQHCVLCTKQCATFVCGIEPFLDGRAAPVSWDSILLPWLGLVLTYTFGHHHGILQFLRYRIPMPNYFYLDANGQKQGPVNDQQLRTLATRGIITPDTPLVADTGHKGKAGQIRGLFNDSSPESIVPVADHPTLKSSSPSANVNRKFLSRSAIACVRSLLYSKSFRLWVLVGSLLLVVTIWWGIVEWNKPPHGIARYNDTFSAAFSGTVQHLKYFNRIGLIDVKVHGSSLLFLAASNPNVEVCKYLISKGVDVNVKNYKGETPLYRAASCHNIEVYKYLISKGADVNVKNNKGETPLHKAASDHDVRNAEVCKYLVSKGADVNVKNNTGGTPLHDTWNVEIAQFLVSKGADINAKTNEGNTPLHTAALDGRIEIFKYLVSEGSDVNAKNNYDETPLHHGFEKISRFVFIQSTDYQEYVIEWLKYIISLGADINAKNKDGRTPLHHAMRSFNIEVCKYLVSQGANVHAKDSDGDTPLHNARNVEIAQFLVSNGADVNAKNSVGQTPLDVAREKNNMADVGLKPVGLTRFDVAREKENMAVVEYLVSVGGKPGSETSIEETPPKQSDVQPPPVKQMLYTAAERQEIDRFCTKYDIKDVKREYKGGGTILHLAAGDGNVAVAKFLIAEGAEVDAKTDAGQTPLDVAIEKNYTAVVEYLASVGGKPGTSINDYIELKGHTYFHFISGASSVSSSVAFSLDGKKVITCGSGMSGRNEIQTVRIWDAESGMVLHELKLEGHNGGKPITVSLDGRKVVSCGSDGTAQIWDVESGKVLKKLEGHTNVVQSVVFSPDGKKVFTCDLDMTARIWDAVPGGEWTKLEGYVMAFQSNFSPVPFAAFSPDGKKMISLGSDGGMGNSTVRIWDAESGMVLHKFKLEGRDSLVQSFAFSPDGRKVISCGSDATGRSGIQTVRIWDVESGKELNNLEGRVNYVPSVVFSPDSTKVITWGSDGIAQIWDTESGKELKKLGLAGNPSFATFSPDSKTVISLGLDKTVRTWDVESGNELKKFELAGIGQVFFCVPSITLFSPDCKKVISYGSDMYNTARIWTLK